MGGGKERKASMAMQTDLAKQQNATSQEYLKMAQGELAKRNDLQQPLVDYYKRLTSGNPSERMTAVAPALADQAKAAQGARGAIEDMPRGAGREYALAQLPMQQYAQGADMLNKAYTSAFPGLAGVGTESGQVGLQQAGAGMRGAESASNTNQSVIAAQQQQKASQLGMIGSIAGLGGSIATGGLSSLGKAGLSKGLTSFNPISMLKKTPLQVGSDGRPW